MSPGCPLICKPFINVANSCSIGRNFVERAMEHGDRCPMAEGEVNFLSSLLTSEKLETERVVSIVMELFTAGIDSVELIAFWENLHESYCNTNDRTNFFFVNSYFATSSLSP